MRLVHFLRMAKWARRPPSARRAMLVGGVIVLCLILYGIEQLFGFPEGWMPGARPGGRIF